MIRNESAKLFTDCRQQVMKFDYCTLFVKPFSVYSHLILRSYLLSILFDCTVPIRYYYFTFYDQMYEPWLNEFFLFARGVGKNEG